MEAFTGTWKYESGENEDKYSSLLGMPAQLVESIKKSTYVMRAESSSRCMWKNDVLTKNKEEFFNLGEEFDVVSPDGSTFKNKVDLKDGKLSGTMAFGSKICKSERYIDGDLLVSVLLVDGQRIVSNFRKV